MNPVYSVYINLFVFADQIGGKLKMDIDIGSMFEPLQAQGSTAAASFGATRRAGLRGSGRPFGAVLLAPVELGAAMPPGPPRCEVSPPPAAPSSCCADPSRTPASRSVVRSCDEGRAAFG